MSVAVKTIPNSSATVAIGSWRGSVTDQNLRRPVAPSIAAASSTSFGIDARPARKITTANGRIRHACTKITEPVAYVDWPSQTGGDTWLTRWRCWSVHVRIEYDGSKIHFQAIRLSAIGAAQGSRITKRRIHLPRKFRIRACASNPAETRTIACEMTVNRNVCQTACWNAAFPHSWRKL